MVSSECKEVLIFLRSRYMREYDPDTLIVHPGNSTDPDIVVEVTPEVAGWDYIHFQVRRLGPLSSWPYATGDHEMAIVPMSGSIRVESDRGQWSHIGERGSVFSGLPYALYLPRHTSLRVTADLEEVYFYKLDRPEGFALSKSPLSHAVREENRSQIWIQPPDHTM
jgi:5-deoxy-D-glucuronate isomerase